MFPRIAIVGGGPAGLTLALLLHKRGISFTIFELRKQLTLDELARPSGSLDLHEESGLAAIRECGLWDQFLRLTGECSEAQKVSDRYGNILHEDAGELSVRPEISRHALIQLLIKHLPREAIRWDHKLLSATTITTNSDNAVQLDFGSHGRHAFDLVIGADGAWSQVRNLLTPVKPYYAGIQNITLTIRELTAKYPQLAALVGRGSFSALGLRHGVMSQRGNQDSARIYIFLTTPDVQAAASLGLKGQSASASKKTLLTDPSLLGRWGSAIKELVAVACDEETADNPGSSIDIRALYTLPRRSSWKHNPHVTLIGDAAHLMCPWAGEGVNLAMWDSFSLSHAIAEASMAANTNGDSFVTHLSPLMQRFEEDQATRAEEKANETHRNGEMLFAENGAEAFTQFFQSAYGGGTI
ncbi:hypothetical protein N7532_009636 [Penicillium argentinense]|uniref:FAD-binding domain-containing protein n=1 Tax=Penicillium argentinense TaxID=1131581 RepID=A0A9W9EZQ7_9EURO|nr:uncharacterized protein N7532_009636 [Penicillium argentinense]KAJ5090952.1 hypothetical protein N7532_009636 [Penicillium argentinense]